MYDILDEQLNSALGVSCGFEGLVTPEPESIGDALWTYASARYEHLRAFQEITLGVFRASLDGDFDPRVAELVLNEEPPGRRSEYYALMPDELFTLPVFFRTDDVGDGKTCEVQCPGSLWGVHEQLHDLYRQMGPSVDSSSWARVPLSQRFANALSRYLPHDPVVHHYLDSSTNPTGMRYFIRRTREHGIRYYGHDRAVGPQDCNFVRQHIFAGHWGDKFAPQRWSRCVEGTLSYDLPPTVLFSEKIPLMFPFWDLTKELYSDEIRDLFPDTQLVTPEGIRLQDAEVVSVEEFCALPASRRDFYFKYASADLTLASQSRGVFLGRTFSKTKMSAFFERMLSGYDEGRYWICQVAVAPKQHIGYVDRDGSVHAVDAHTKTSCFFGPDGLSGILRMHRPFYKVHGGSETILSIAV